MASIGLSICSTSKPLMLPPASSSSLSPSCLACRCSTAPMHCSSRSRLFPLTAGNMINRSRPQTHVVRMAPDEEKLTRRNPLDFPVEWTRPKPGRRPDIFPQFSPMKTPLPPPLPYDPPEEDGEEEEKEKEGEEEEEEDPENPDSDQ